MVWYVFQLLIDFYIVRSWVRWKRSGDKFPPQGLRNWSAFLGFLFASASALVATISGVLLFLAMLPYFSYFLATISEAVSAFGLLASLLGALLAAIGKGKARLPGVIASLVMLLLWVGLGFRLMS